MNNKINTNLLLFFFFIMNCAMIAPNKVPEPNNTNTVTHTALKEEKGKALKQKQKRKRKTVSKTNKTSKRIKKIRNAVDSGALLIAIGAVIVMAMAVYYFFSIGFFTGVLALAAAVLLLYLLFQYLEY